MLRLLFLTNLAATLFMVGVIWMVQVVHYPLFAKVGLEGFRSYAASHNLLISFIVMPAMLLEAGSALLLVLQRPSFVTFGEALVGLLLVGVAWGGTFFLSVPQHNILAQGFDLSAHQRLVATNWIRTAAWTLRGGLVLWQISKAMIN